MANDQTPPAGVLPPLRMAYSRGWDTLTIEGVRYAGGVFRTLGLAPIGSESYALKRWADSWRAPGLGLGQSSARRVAR